MQLGRVHARLIYAQNQVGWLYTLKEYNDALESYDIKKAIEVVMRLVSKLDEKIQLEEAFKIIKQDFDSAFKQVDVLLSPTAPTTAFNIAEKIDDPVSMYLSDIFTIGVNLAGLPAISIPCGFSDGLPVGLQLIAPHLQESKLLNYAHQYQLLNDWHKRIPEKFC